MSALSSIPKIFADSTTWPAIMNYGQNTPEDWYHPLTKHQYKTLRNLTYGDAIQLCFKGSLPIPLVVVNLGDDTAMNHLTSLFGTFQSPGWNFTHVIRVKKV
jgi:hypothetical protein